MRAPRLPSLFKLTEHNRYRRFSYEPRTFDARKEKLEERRRAIEMEMKYEGRLSTGSKEAIRERISQSWHHRETRRQKRNSGMRLLLILGILVALIYAISANMGLSL